jgi:hypothetical protein
MSDPKLCIFANFFIDNEERLQRMKDSFKSFREVMPEEWRINIRGSLSHEAGKFLLEELRDNLTLNYKDSNKGWLYDSYALMKDIQSDFVLYWIEDHICLVNPTLLRSVVSEMKLLSVDQLWYSWFKPSTRQPLYHLPNVSRGENIIVFKVDKETTKNARKSLGSDFFVVSALSIMKKELLLSILCSNRPFLKRWAKHLPFDFEKKSKDGVIGSILLAIPKLELFASIDDDNGDPGYCLISRGLYENRISRPEMKMLEFGHSGTSKKFLIIPNPVRSFLIKLYSILRRIGFSLSYFMNR